MESEIHEKVRDTVTELIICELKELGLLDETAWRNYKIITAYNALVTQGVKYSIATEILADKFFTCKRNIEVVIYDWLRKSPIEKPLIKPKKKWPVVDPVILPKR